MKTGELNPSEKGNYPIEIQFSNAGELSGTTIAVASITSAPVPVIAAYNQLHDGRNEDWQHVKSGQTAALPIDFLVTLPDKPAVVYRVAARSHRRTRNHGGGQ